MNCFKLLSLFRKAFLISSLLFLFLGSGLFCVSIIGDVRLFTGIEEYNGHPEILNDSGYPDRFSASTSSLRTMESFSKYIKIQIDGVGGEREKVYKIWEIVCKRFVHPPSHYIKHTLFTNYIIYFLRKFSGPDHGLPVFLKYPQLANLFVVKILGCPLPDGSLLYTLRNTDLLINHTYGACDQLNQVLLDILRLNGFKTAILAVPEHTSSLVRVDGMWYIVDADREVTNVGLKDYKGLELYLASGALERLYAPRAQNNPMVAKMFDRYRKGEYTIFDYNGTWQVVAPFLNFENDMQRLKYLVAISIIAFGLILYGFSYCIKYISQKKSGKNK